MRGKIIRGIAGFYDVHDGAGTVYSCRAKGIFRSRGIRPLPGDDVGFDILSERDAEGNITEILPRRSELIRPAVANVDQCMLVFACQDPEPHFGLLDRFLVMMEKNGIPSCICLNKLDLPAGEKQREAFARRFTGSGYPLIGLSARTGEGVGELRARLRGKTTFFAGPSGVGKSSLLNCLFPEAFAQTGEVSEKIRRGRHTTRRSELFWLEKDTFLFDTPGFSTLDLDGIAAEDLRFYFPEFSPYEGSCRFQGCLHDREPDCRVREALDRGEISRERYGNYRIFLQECRARRKY